MHTSIYKMLAAVMGVILLGGCSISYQFSGTSIDYTQVRSISIKDFPNMAPLVYGPLAQRSKCCARTVRWTSRARSRATS